MLANWIINKIALYIGYKIIGLFFGKEIKFLMKLTYLIYWLFLR